MPRGKKTEDPTRAAIMAALLAGQGVMEIARELKVAHAVVSGIKATIPAHQFDEVRRKKGERFEEALSACLLNTLEAMAAQAKIASEPTYIRKQSASELAVLYGVFSDKSIRLLTAAQRANQSVEEAEA